MDNNQGEYTLTTTIGSAGTRSWRIGIFDQNRTLIGTYISGSNFINQP